MRTDKQVEDAGAGSLKYMQFPESVGNEDTKQEECAGYPDESKEEIECFFYGWHVNGSD